MNKTIQLFIGSNNETHKVELELLTRTLGKYHQGFTIQPATGYWMGAQEDSVTVIISDDEHQIRATVGILKHLLKQDAIAIQEVAPLEFI